MRPDVQAVQDFITKNVRYARLDIDVLVNVVKSLQKSERKLLLVEVDDDNCEYYNYLMQKVFNRHNDVVAGFTKLLVCGPDVEVITSAKSNVSELAQSLAEYEALKECGFDMIGDTRDSVDAKRILDAEDVILSKE